MEMKLTTRAAILKCFDRAVTMAAARRVFEVASADHIISTQLVNRFLTHAIYACSVVHCSVFRGVQSMRVDTGQSEWLARCEAIDSSDRPRSTGVYCVFVTVFACGLKVEAVLLVGSNVQRTTTLDRNTTTIAFMVLLTAVFCSSAFAADNIISATVLAGNSGSFVGPANETIFTHVIPLDDSTEATTNRSWDSLGPGDTWKFTATYTVTQQDVDLLQ